MTGYLDHARSVLTHHFLLLGPEGLIADEVPEQGPEKCSH